MEKKKETAKNHSEFVGLRLTEKELSILERVKKTYKYGTLSQAIRYLLFDKNRALFAPANDGEVSESDRKILQAAELFYPEFKLVATRLRKYTDSFTKVASMKKEDGTTVLDAERMERNLESIRTSVDRLATILNGVLESCGSDKRVADITPVVVPAKEDEKKPQRQLTTIFILNLQLMNLERIMIRGKVASDAQNVGTADKPRYRFLLMTSKTVKGTARPSYFLVYTNNPAIMDVAKKGTFLIVGGHLAVGVNNKDGKNNISLIVDSDIIQNAGSDELYFEEITIHGKYCGIRDKVRSSDGKDIVRFKVDVQRIVSGNDGSSVIETEYLPFIEESAVKHITIGTSVFVVGRLNAFLGEDGKPVLNVDVRDLQKGYDL